MPIRCNESPSRIPGKLPQAPLSASLSAGSILTGTLCTLLILSGAEQAKCAEFSLKPTITLSEEYTDNVLDTNSPKKTDFITQAQPGILFSYQAPFWDWNLSYAYDYRHYAKGSQADDYTQNANLQGLLKLVDEKLFLDVSDTYQRVSLNVARDTSNETLFQNQSDQNVGTLSPYLVLHPTGTLMVKTGYRYVNTWYKDSLAVSKQSHTGFLDTTYEMTPRFFATAGYSYTKELSETAGNGLTYQQAYLGPRYEYADKSFIFAQGGAIMTRYSTGPQTPKPYWNAGLTHTSGTVVANLISSLAYTEDPTGAATLTTTYGADLSKNFQQGTLTVLGSYTEFSLATSHQTNTKRYSTGFRSTYDLTQDLHGTLGLTFDRYQDVILDTVTREYSVDASLTYALAKATGIGITYHYVNYSSAEVAIDNREINRIIFNVNQSF